ncbi:HsdM family class I SAM-dependent methyltransferase [Brachyspira aalborgi]|uniref:site-specific DNA-methyltransferase (adenine-specific) n=1 Tax=Brachyspira aalborgi TaxID=29522 RepID=A0A5C8EF28_9SPIR|nr:N-6 DNA methylase [Brachyspira aalborgi]TXJ36303.1 SAM-dependent DNA methyltransferase [Brachyspira aalborgi]
MLAYKTEDEVRDEARILLNLTNNEDKTKSGVGQLTSFSSLDNYYFKGISKRPDGWYFPNDIQKTAIILETKASNELLDEKNENQIKEYIKITQRKYKKVVGILYNSNEAIVYKNDVVYSATNQLFDKNYYLKLFNNIQIDIDKIQSCTININEILHHKFVMQNLTQRMIFTACALVADRKGANLENLKNLSFSMLKYQIIEILEKSYSEEMRSNEKLKIIKEQYQKITCDKENDINAIGDFIDNVIQISKYIQSNDWQGEDVMAIFFNEFNRYLPKKPDYGQVFTPDNVVSLMYRLIEANYKDKILDAACGSGAFLVKAMGNMTREVGGITNDKEVKKIQNEKLFGVEISKDLFTLACANMLIHKDGKTNLIQADSRDKEVCDWIKSKNITKVLMNPPYEKKYGVMGIVENVLNNVSEGAMCAFLLPDNKLEISRKTVERWLKKHSLLKIIKLPDNTFTGKASVNVSIFIFKAHEPQKEKEIFACWIKEDGLETVKNKGRQDIKGKWKNELEDYWYNIIYKQSGNETCQWLKPSENLSYKMPETPFEISENDFRKVVLDYMLFERGIDKKEFEKTILEKVLYESDIIVEDKTIKITLKDEEDEK